MQTVRHGRTRQGGLTQNHEAEGKEGNVVIGKAVRITGRGRRTAGREGKGQQRRQGGGGRQGGTKQEKDGMEGGRG